MEQALDLHHYLACGSVEIVAFCFVSQTPILFKNSIPPRMKRFIRTILILVSGQKTSHIDDRLPVLVILEFFIR